MAHEQRQELIAQEQRGMTRTVDPHQLDVRRRDLGCIRRYLGRHREKVVGALQEKHRYGEREAETARIERDDLGAQRRVGRERARERDPATAGRERDTVAPAGMPCSAAPNSGPKSANACASRGVGAPAYFDFTASVAVSDRAADRSP